MSFCMSSSDRQCVYSSCYSVAFTILDIHLLYRFWTIRELEEDIELITFILVQTSYNCSILKVEVCVPTGHNYSVPAAYVVRLSNVGYLNKRILVVLGVLFPRKTGRCGRNRASPSTFSWRIRKTNQWRLFHQKILCPSYPFSIDDNCYATKSQNDIF